MNGATHAFGRVATEGAVDDGQLAAAFKRTAVAVAPIVVERAVRNIRHTIDHDSPTIAHRAALVTKGAIGDVQNARAVNKKRPATPAKIIEKGASAYVGRAALDMNRTAKWVDRTGIGVNTTVGNGEMVKANIPPKDNKNIKFLGR